ncbi:MAG: carbohydrate ABC transporter permease [Oscillospiraceae bacterium]|nr:carbohydrate ABC transporter permease [Oscillospiraceae bacterium]
MKVLNKTGFYLIALSFFVIFGFPFVLILLMSFKSMQEYMRGNLWGFPEDVFLGNFQRVFAADFNIYFRNSILVAVVTVTIVLIVASMAAYAFANLSFKLNKPLFILFLVGMMIPVHTPLVPIFQLTRTLGIMDPIPGLIGPYVSFGLPVAIFLLSSFFREIPASIMESARIDGASHYRIHWGIIMPLSTPAIATVAIHRFLLSWNEFIFALTIIRSSENRTLPLGIRQFYDMESVNIPAIFTAILIGSLPVMLFYFFAQERVISGLSAGAVKG